MAPFTTAVPLTMRGDCGEPSVDPAYLLAKSTCKPSDVTKSSDTEPRAPPLRFLRNLTQRIRSSGSPPSGNITESQPAASIPSQGTEDIVNRPPPAEWSSSNLEHSPAAATNEPSIPKPYRTAVKIPHLRKPVYVFPDASSSITQAHKDRYPALKDIFQRNIESSPKLCGYTTYISYELRMCGSCVADTMPSILVFCPSDGLKKIKSLLTQPHIRSQFDPESSTPIFVRFGLFFWAQPIEMLALHGLTVFIPDEPDSGDSIADAVIGSLPWGLQIMEADHGERRSATMGCVIKVGDERFGLTTAHAFHNLPATAPRIHVEDTRDSDTDDEDYDMSMKEEDHLPLEVRPMSSSDLRGRTVRLGKCQVHTAPTLEDTAWMKEHANLDWALFEMESHDDQMPTFSTENEVLPIAKSLPQERTDVLIITPSLLGVPATLYNIPSYIGGTRASPVTEVWTAGCISKGNPIRKGDSGSIVVDARSRELYGMVVAANPFGDIHIAPFAAILAQVKELFKSEHADVLNAPQRLRSSTFRPSLEAKSLLQDHLEEKPKKIDGRYPEVIDRPSRVPHSMRDEHASEAGTLVAHQADVGMLESAKPWPQASSSSIKERHSMEKRVGGKGSGPASSEFLSDSGTEEPTMIEPDREKGPPLHSSTWAPSAVEPTEIESEDIMQPEDTIHTSGTNLVWLPSDHFNFKRFDIDCYVYTRANENEATISRAPSLYNSLQSSVWKYIQALPPTPESTPRRFAISKSTVVREAIEECGFVYEETDLAFYIMDRLTNNDVLKLAENSKRIRAGANQGTSRARDKSAFHQDMPPTRLASRTLHSDMSTIHWPSIVASGIAVLLFLSTIVYIITSHPELSPINWTLGLIMTMVFVLLSIASFSFEVFLFFCVVASFVGVLHYTSMLGYPIAMDRVHT